MGAFQACKRQLASPRKIADRRAIDSSDRALSHIPFWALIFDSRRILAPSLNLFAKPTFGPASAIDPLDHMTLGLRFGQTSGPLCTNPTICSGYRFTASHLWDLHVVFVADATSFDRSVQNISDTPIAIAQTPRNATDENPRSVVRSSPVTVSLMVFLPSASPIWFWLMSAWRGLHLSARLLQGPEYLLARAS